MEHLLLSSLSSRDLNAESASWIFGCKSVVEFWLAQVRGIGSCKSILKMKLSLWVGLVVHFDSSNVFIYGYELVISFLPWNFLSLFNPNDFSDVLITFPESRVCTVTCSSDANVIRLQCWLLEIEVFACPNHWFANPLQMMFS